VSSRFPVAQLPEAEMRSCAASSPQPILQTVITSRWNQRYTRSMGPIARTLISMAVLMTAGCGHPQMPRAPGVCRNGDFHEVYSPDRAWKAIRFNRWCAGDDFVYQVSVVRASEPLPSDPGNVLRERPATLSAEIQLVWEKPRELWVIHNYQMTLDYSVSQVEDVTIVHTTRKLVPDQ
jgi:hypothetical protein